MTHCMYIVLASILFSKLLVAQTLIIGPLTGIRLFARIDDPPPSPAVIEINGAPNVQFKYDHVDSGTRTDVPNFLVVSPPSGTTGAGITHALVGLNPDVTNRMNPGVYFLTLHLAAIKGGAPSGGGSIIVSLTLTTSQPFIQSVQNAASHQAVISPGAIVSIRGSHLGQPLGSALFNAIGQYPTDYGATSVTINGIPATILYASPDQVKAVVPYGVTGKTADVILTRFGFFTVDAYRQVLVAATSPGIFTSTSNGTGQGAILNYPDYTDNSPDNPAPIGSVIVLFATGIGAWNPPVDDGSITMTANKFTAQPVSLTIGGQPATIYYSGTSPFQLWGLLQVIAYVPTNIGSGDQPVVLKVGDNDNTAQNVTIAVQ